ncbi:hypothetical protein B0H11DRAFT_1930543 [Mycena galericulata]|nr:hypothetical protein B0H11DRAFT_1930543 [Mycena galericulata]
MASQMTSGANHPKFNRGNQAASYQAIRGIEKYEGLFILHFELLDWRKNTSNLDDPNLRFSTAKYERKPSYDGGKRLSVQSARRDAAKCTVAPRQYFCADPAIERADAHQNHWLNYLENGINRAQLKGQNVVARWKIHSLRERRSVKCRTVIEMRPRSSLTWFTIIWCAQPLSAIWLEIWRLRDVRRDAAKYPMAPRPYFCADLAVESAQAVKNFLECVYN